MHFCNCFGNKKRLLIYLRFVLCVSADSGFLFTCGNGSFGQLGHGDNMSLSTPVNVSYFLDKSVKMVACGMRHSLVLFTGNV